MRLGAAGLHAGGALRISISLLCVPYIVSAGDEIKDLERDSNAFAFANQPSALSVADVYGAQRHNDAAT